MKSMTSLVVLMTFTSLVMAQTRVELSPLFGDIDHPADERLIEPTSPILGKNLVLLLKEDLRHPDAIVKDLRKKNPRLIRDIQLASVAYFKTMTQPLLTYCATEKKEEANDKAIDVVETAAIPLEVLIPLHSSYIENLLSLRTNFVERPKNDINKLAMEAAVDYQAKRYSCDLVQKLSQMETKAKKYLPKRFDRLVDLHHQISSPEAAFPRIQFSINGFTQHVHGKLLEMPYDRLETLLRIIYDEQVEWIFKKENNQTTERYFTSFENKALDSGFLPREILLVLAYSTRNMPSLDVQYGYSPEKALLLEAYFWKFHKHHDYVTKKFEKDIFPNAVMKRNPGLYHYATSALLACEVRLHGYSGAMARIVALGNKVGYKVHKLLGELAGKDGKKSLKEIRETANRQGFGPGVDAGKYGGKHGVKFCRKNTPKEFWLKNEVLSAPPELAKENPSGLDKEDLDPDWEEAI
jgi:hypothetical protein